jgi:hypothetical protein
MHGRSVPPLGDGRPPSRRGGDARTHACRECRAMASLGGQRSTDPLQTGRWSARLPASARQAGPAVSSTRGQTGCAVPAPNGSPPRPTGGKPSVDGPGSSPGKVTPVKNGRFTDRICSTQRPLPSSFQGPLGLARAATSCSAALYDAAGAVSSCSAALHNHWFGPLSDRFSLVRTTPGSAAAPPPGESEGPQTRATANGRGRRCPLPSERPSTAAAPCRRGRPGTVGSVRRHGMPPGTTCLGGLSSPKGER